MLSGKTDRDGYGLALATASTSWTEAEGPSRLSQRRTACRMIEFKQSWKIVKGISGWLHITASADFIRRRRPFAIIQKQMACRARSSARTRRRAAVKVKTVKWSLGQ